jgi:hypothetical protein
MKFVRETRLLVFTLMFMSLGGWLMHLRIHPPPIDPDGAHNPAFWIPFIFGLINVFVSPILLSFARTLIIGYLMNGISVVIGIILMSTLSLSGLPHPLTFASLVLNTTFPVMILLFGKLFVGQQILLHHHPKGMGRMFTVGWWARHFVYLSVIFSIGHFLWR